MIIRALQLAFIILAIADIYPFYGREPVLFPKDTAKPDGFVRALKADRLAQALMAEEEKPDKEKIVLASLPPADKGLDRWLNNKKLRTIVRSSLARPMTAKWNRIWYISLITPIRKSHLIKNRPIQSWRR